MKNQNQNEAREESFIEMWEDWKCGRESIEDEVVCLGRMDETEISGTITEVLKNNPKRNTFSFPEICNYDEELMREYISLVGVSSLELPFHSGEKEYKADLKKLEEIGENIMELQEGGR